MVQNKLVVKVINEAAEGLRVYDINRPGEKAKLLHEVDLPERGSISDEQASDNSLLFSYQTYTEPTKFMSLNMGDYSLETFFDSKFFKEKLHYDPDDYISDHVEFKSKDGAMVPLSIIRKKDTLPSLENPKQPILTHLTAYGGFGNIKKPEFSPSNLVFFNNLGGILVIAHIRGGGEKGLNWQLDGKKEKRQNHFDDFIGAAEYLIKIGITDPQHLVISGSSNGGVLMATVANQRPDLFALVQCNVPVTDMLRFPHFTGGRAWKGEYGDAEEEGGASKILEWSPLHNVKAQKYPVMWIVTGDNDDRVVPSHALKYAAELQYTAGQV